MRRAVIFILCLALLSGCQASDIRSYWNDVPLLEADIRLSEDRFADFAELAIAAPEADALAAMDVLFDRLTQDSVAYYVYSEWVDGAFYNPLSPCRSASLYGKAVERMVADAVLELNECEPFLQRREWIEYNQPGAPATVPGCASFDSRTLVLVLDLSCPSCRQALERLSSDSQWAGLRHVAVCCGRGTKPDVPGWEYLFPENFTVVFDPHVTPIYFLVAADGSVEHGYTPAF